MVETKSKIYREAIKEPRKKSLTVNLINGNDGTFQQDSAAARAAFAQFTSTPKYIGVFLSDITPTTDGREKPTAGFNTCEPEATAPTPKTVKKESALKHWEEWLCCLLCDQSFESFCGK
ncbi:hypothetical protein TNCV_2670101 [Trichonephila clavipes]|nr:hypothetical protein TNCV_2670101 [Trichonephila clavipes]